MSLACKRGTLKIIEAPSVSQKTTFTCEIYGFVSIVLSSPEISEDVVICGSTSGQCVVDYQNELQIEFSALGREFSFHLVPSNPLTSAYGDYGIPVMVMGDKEKKIKMLQFQKHNIHFYHDVNTLAAFAVQFTVINNTRDLLSLDGILPGIQEDIVISPVRMSGSRWTQGGGVVAKHRVTVRSHPRNKQTDQNDSIDLPHNIPRDSNFHPFPKIQSVKGTVEVLVWTDYSVYQSFLSQVGPHGNVESEITWYVAVLANAADKIYKLGVRDPTFNISLTLAGTVICTTRNCSRFTEDHRVNNTVNNHVALSDFAVQLSEAYQETKIHFRFDQATAMTRLDIVDPHGTPIGVSFTDKICSLSDGKSSSLVEDQGAFSNVGTFAHEIAHNLGSDHDGWGRSTSCSAGDGYLMSPLSPLVKNGFYFSKCSIASMKQNLLKPSSSCIYDTPPVNHLYTSLASTMPGQVYNTTEQCRAIYGTSFCLSIGTTLADICYKMYCWDPKLANVCSTKSAAALGTTCGSKKWCVEGECVHDPRAP